MQSAEGIFKCLGSLCNSDVKTKTESTKSCHEIETTRYSEYAFIKIGSIIDRRFKSLLVRNYSIVGQRWPQDLPTTISFNINQCWTSR